MYSQKKSQKNSFSKVTLLAVLAAASGTWNSVVLAQDQVQVQTQIYGSQLMSSTERTDYQSKLRSFKTDVELEAFRLDHHEKMKVRAAEKGLILPAVAPSPGTGLGPKKGSGLGTGAGAGQRLPAK